jgi:hypothetical protein
MILILHVSLLGICQMLVLHACFHGLARVRGDLRSCTASCDFAANNNNNNIDDIIGVQGSKI